MGLPARTGLRDGPVCAALALFGQVAALLSELLPISGAQNVATVRNRTLRVGGAVMQSQGTKTAQQRAAKPAEPVVVGLDGGYVRSRHRQDERHFEVIAGKVIDAHGIQSRFAFARNGPTMASDCRATPGNQPQATSGTHPLGVAFHPNWVTTTKV